MCKDRVHCTLVQANRRPYVPCACMVVVMMTMTTLQHSALVAVRKQPLKRDTGPMARSPPSQQVAQISLSEWLGAWNAAAPPQGGREGGGHRCRESPTQRCPYMTAPAPPHQGMSEMCAAGSS